MCHHCWEYELDCRDCLDALKAENAQLRGAGLPTAALYHRVSTVDQDPQLARQDLRAAALGRGFEVGAEVEETGSGASNDRPGLAKVMDAARRGQVRAVLVWKLDRFGRSALDVLANVRALQAAGVRFVCVTQGIDTGDGGPTAQLLLTVLAAVAEFERDLIRERTRAGLVRARARGKRLGRPVALPWWDQLIRARAARACGWSWRRAAADSGLSVGYVRRAVPSLSAEFDVSAWVFAKNGAPKPGPRSPRKRRRAG